jgi:hypothetical protein
LRRYITSGASPAINAAAAAQLGGRAITRFVFSLTSAQLQLLNFTIFEL